MSGALWIRDRVMFASFSFIRGARMGLAILAVVLLGSEGALAQTEAERIAALERSLQSLRSEIAAMKAGTGAKQSAPTVSGPQSPVPNADSTCPPGSYVVGVKSWGAPGSTRYCIGCMTGVQVICQHLGGP